MVPSLSWLGPGDFLADAGIDAALFIELRVGDIRVGDAVLVGGDGVRLIPAGEALPSAYPESVLIMSSACGFGGSGFWTGLQRPAELVWICSEERARTGEGRDVFTE